MIDYREETNVITNFINALTSEGGLFRVRALAFLGMTGGGIGYMLANGAMPPAEYNLIWASYAGYYFGTRGAS